jgi:hypothetical protein
MLKQPISVGDLVEYHGSITDKHGLYTVALVPEDKDGRGYNLTTDTRPYGEHRLWNVHRDSFTLKAMMGGQHDD